MKRSGMAVHSTALLDVSTSTPIPNQTVGRYAPASLALCMSRSHAVLRYVLREPRMVNLCTANNTISDQSPIMGNPPA